MNHDTAASSNTTMPTLITRFIQIYAHLWIVEGAVRKWIPALDAPFYILRDILVLCAIAAFGLSLLRPRRSGFLFWVAVAIMSVLTALGVLLGDVDPAVALVGIRSYLAPIALIYLAWRYASPGAFARVCRIILAYSFVQASIVVLQVLSSRSSWINRETGGEEASFINSGFVRASGTFTSPAGLTLFLPLALVVALLAVRGLVPVKRSAGLLAVGVVLVTTLVSGSRGALVGVAVILAIFVLYQMTVKDIRGAGGIALLVFALAGTATVAVMVFPDVLESFVRRFADASRSENSALRVFNQTFGFAGQLGSVLGDGPGSHSQAGIRAGAAGPWIEVEASRWVGELGVIGWLMGWLRVGAVVAALLWLANSKSRGDLALWLLLAAAVPVVLYGQITQTPSAQGFMALVVAMMIFSYDSRHALSPEPDFAPSSNFEGRRKPHG